MNGILDFRGDFPQADGAPAPVEVLTTSRRSGARLLEATRRITQRMPLTRLPAHKVRAHRELSPVRDGGRAEVYTYPTSGTELDNIADILRRAHLEDGIPWSDMAVLVRAGSRSIPGVRRALTAAGVPLDIDGDDLPLRHEPAVTPLLTALKVVARADTPDASDTSDASDASDASDTPDTTDASDSPNASETPENEYRLDTETALELLTSPLAGMDTADLRRLGRALREEERASGNALPPPSDELLARALVEPERLALHDPAYARGAQRLGALLATARQKLADGGTAEEALWELWNGTPGRTGSSAPPVEAARPGATRTVTWTPSAPCSPSPRARRSAPEAVAPATSWRSWRPRTSRPTPSPDAPCAPTPCA